VDHLPTIVLGGLLGLLVLSFVLRGLLARLVNHYGRARWRATYRRLRAVRTNRFKLTRKQRLVDQLARDPVVRGAVLAHADETGGSLGEAEAKVQTYLAEIIPAFDLVSYYRLGYPIARAAVNLIYKQAVRTDAVGDPKSLHRDAAVVYVFNHRSNADFIFASFALTDRVQLSYAVGEWARVWPLDKLFRSFGSYFVRRGYREKLYHQVLRRYVQRITKEGVTQGIFLEGGLSRDGAFRPVKTGLVDALLQVLREEGFEKDLVFVPGAINYDRVLEDRSLVAEGLGKKPPRSMLRMARQTFRILFRNTLKLAFRRMRKHGYVGLRLGPPVSAREYLAAHPEGLLDEDREVRRAPVQAFCDHLLDQVRQLMPVCAVPLTCLALCRLDHSALQDDLEEEVAELRDLLERAGHWMVRGDKTPEEMTRYAITILEMRGIIVRDDAGVLRVPEAERPIVRYYSLSIAHLVPEGTPPRLVRELM